MPKDTSRQIVGELRSAVDDRDHLWKWTRFSDRLSRWSASFLAPLR